MELWQDRRRMVRFGLVGASNTVFDFGLFTVLSTYAHWGLIPANVVAYTVAVTNSFILNRKWTFSTSGNKQNHVADFLLFVAGNVLGLFLSTGLILVLTPIMPSVLAKAIAIGIGFPWNFWYSRTFVYTAKRGYGRPAAPAAAPVSSALDTGAQS
ncbi:MAG: GtrA family protein [Firmicutes bacterium]|nr:GtrA family protein [Bacillota bacterium]